MKKLFILFIISFSIQANRLDPITVSPLRYRGIEYRAPHWNGKMGFIEAYDVNTGKKLWGKQVYKVIYEPMLETDVQDIFITSLKIDGGSLIVENEKGDRYRLDPTTGKSMSLIRGTWRWAKDKWNNFFK